MIYTTCLISIIALIELFDPKTLINYCYVQTQDFGFLYLKEKEFGKGRYGRTFQISLSQVNAL